MKNKWYPFDPLKGSYQKRPPLRKHVLVKRLSTQEGIPESIAVGYMKNATGDKQCPQFIVPGLGGIIVAWNDCLPDDYEWPVPCTKEQIDSANNSFKTIQRQVLRTCFTTEEKLNEYIEVTCKKDLGVFTERNI